MTDIVIAAEDVRDIFSWEEALSNPAASVAQSTAGVGPATGVFFLHFELL